MPLGNVNMPWKIIFLNQISILANICQDYRITMANQFGIKIRTLRLQQNKLLRHVASEMDVDTSIMSKIERGDRILKKEQIPIIASILKADTEELQTLWLADQIYDVIKDEKQATEALKSVAKKIKGN
jgi:transcriptional regulator with XRE-family HTH domain